MTFKSITAWIVGFFRKKSVTAILGGFHDLIDELDGHADIQQKAVATADSAIGAWQAAKDFALDEVAQAKAARDKIAGILGL